MLVDRTFPSYLYYLLFIHFFASQTMDEPCDLLRKTASSRKRSCDKLGKTCSKSLSPCTNVQCLSPTATSKTWIDNSFMSAQDDTRTEVLSPKLQSERVNAGKSRVHDAKEQIFISDLDHELDHYLDHDLDHDSKKNKCCIEAKSEIDQYAEPTFSTQQVAGHPGAAEVGIMNINPVSDGLTFSQFLAASTPILQLLSQVGLRLCFTCSFLNVY